ncbi:MAG: hypothetical protein KKG33_05755 [candidate division Zixibacteria bacterium]|nr:hypothetical protein [candidate division Zixibacteria bacterium]MBU2625046.1 hypothetical protein [candidate division Zixibacteria bacterium]
MRLRSYGSTAADDIIGETATMATAINIILSIDCKYRAEDPWIISQLFLP